MYEFSDKISEGSGHKPLECRWGIKVTHLYDTALECTKYCGEHGFIQILRLNASLLIGLSHVQLGPELSSCYVLMNSVLLREGCYILPGIIVLLLQIKYNAQGTVFLQNTQHRCGLLICCGYPPSCCGVSLNFLS